MKKIPWNKISNIIFVLVMIVVGYRFVQNSNKLKQIENRVLEPVKLLHYNPNNTNSNIVTFGLDTPAPAILIFWSVNCLPCQIELARYNMELQDKKLNPDEVMFINIGDSLKEIRKFLARKKYYFNVYQDSTHDLARQINLMVTPTTLYINETLKVINAYSGLHPFAISDAEKFIKKYRNK